MMVESGFKAGGVTTPVKSINNQDDVVPIVSLSSNVFHINEVILFVSVQYKRGKGNIFTQNYDCSSFTLEMPQCQQTVVRKYSNLVHLHKKKLYMKAKSNL